MVDKLFLVTRADLDDGDQAVQAAHALREFVEHHPEVDRAWYKKSNTLAFLAVPNEQALGVLLERALERGIPAAPFHEPDMDNELTAIAIGPAGQRLCSGLPLALARGQRRKTWQQDSNPADVMGSSPSGPTNDCP